jgi:hypothetical protein
LNFFRSVGFATTAFSLAVLEGNTQKRLVILEEEEKCQGKVLT